jgi:sterol desaturase/sphingolipid hydroxylase (fatty acid hydroxylase superfamily)
MRRARRAKRPLAAVLSCYPPPMESRLTQNRAALRRWLAIAACVLSSVIVWREAAADGVLEGGALERIYGSYAPYAQAFFDDLVRLVLFCLVALPFQALFPGVRRRPKILSYEFWLDAIYWFQGLLLAMLSFFFLLQWITDAIYGRGGYFPALAELPPWLQVLIALWAFDFVVYWRHRIEHTFSLFWAFHAVHHTAEQVDILTTRRLHPLEILTGAVLNAFVFRLGFDLSAAAFAFSLYLYYNYFIHTNVRIRFPGFLRYILVSPFMHQWHHAKINKTGKNYGVVFAWNDWLFGTAQHPDHYPTEFGLDVPPDEQVGQSYVRHLLYPLQYAWARLRAARAPVVVAGDSGEAAAK